MPGPWAAASASRRHFGALGVHRAYPQFDLEARGPKELQDRKNTRGGPEATGAVAREEPHTEQQAWRR